MAEAINILDALPIKAASEITTEFVVRSGGHRAHIDPSGNAGGCASAQAHDEWALLRRNGRI